MTEAGGASHRAIEDSERDGPRPWQDDSWDEPVAWDNSSDWDATLADDSERYRPRRRAGLGFRLREWCIAAGIVSVITASTVALLLSPGHSPPAYRDTFATDFPTLMGSVQPPGGTATTQPSTNVVVDGQTRGTTPLTVPTGGRTTSNGATSSAPTPTPTSPPFPAVTLEAESGALAGTAVIRTYSGASGGSVVDKLGDWQGQEPGTIAFSGLTIPNAGRYQITIYYVNPEKIGPRTATVTISGAQPVGVSFGNGSSDCCQTRLLEVVLTAGVHTVTITNATSKAPAIDRIVVSRS